MKRFALVSADSLENCASCGKGHPTKKLIEVQQLYKPLYLNKNYTGYTLEIYFDQGLCMSCYAKAIFKKYLSSFALWCLLLFGIFGTLIGVAIAGIVNIFYGLVVLIISVLIILYSPKMERNLKKQSDILQMTPTFPLSIKCS